MVTQMLGVRLTEREEEEVKKLVEAGLYISVSEFIRESVRKNLASLKVIQIRDIPKAKAKKEIIDYLKTHKEAYASDISEQFSLDLDFVFTILKEMQKEGVVE